MGCVGVNNNISISIISFCRLDPHALMPAVHSAYRVRMNRKRKILMHSAFLPEDSIRIRIIALEGFDAFYLTQSPTSIAQFIQFHES